MLAWPTDRVVRRRRALGWAVAVVLALGAAACGSSNSNDPGSTAKGSSVETRPAAKDFKVGLVTDGGGLNDRGFNHLAYTGLLRAKDELGIQERVALSKTPNDFLPNLVTLARQKYDLIIGVGFLLQDPMQKAAAKFPDQKFAIIDVDVNSFKTPSPQNVQGLLFHEEESGCLAGVVAALAAKDAGGVISSVGGLKIPAVDHYTAGYEYCAKKAVPDVTTLQAYSQDFVDVAKCKEIALDQIARGSKVVFNVAGGCGLGALDAAKEKGVKAIGVDADQAYLGPQVLTSAITKIDVAVFEEIKGALEGKFAGGTNAVFDLEDGATGLGRTQGVKPEWLDKAHEFQQQIQSGELKVPTTVE